MKPKDIRRCVRAAFKSATLVSAHAGPEIHEAIQLGREHDADALFIATLRRNNLECAIVVGRSLLFGDEAMEYLVDYYDQDQKRATEWLEQMANDAAHDLRVDGETFFGLMKAEGDERWRGFRGSQPMTIDEVRILARTTTT